MTSRHTNLLIGLLLVSAVVTGLLANTIDSGWTPHPAVIHGVIAVGIVVVIPWKAVVIRRGLRRARQDGPRSPRWWSLGLLVCTLTALATGFVHATGATDRLGPLTVMQVHIGAAVIALVLVVVHWRLHPARLRRADASRRTALGLAALTAGAVATRAIWEGGLSISGAPGATRRGTGSHELASGDPDRMPVTSWLDDAVQRIDPATWTIDVAGDRLTLADLDAMPQDDVEGLLDCTSGWYSTQMWSGVRLDRLLGDRATGPLDGRDVEVISATGYSRILPARDLHRLWLATGVGGRPLSAGHGAPARLVAPDRRGFWWVKWVVAVRPTDRPWWSQPPFPLT